MIRATILFTRKGKGGVHDDRIHIREVYGSSNIFKVSYRTPEFKKHKQFLITYSGVLDYVEDILQSMKHDVDPFEYVQVCSLIHPSVMFHVSDLDNDDVHTNILNIVRDSLRLGVTNEAM